MDGATLIRIASLSAEIDELLSNRGCSLEVCTQSLMMSIAMQIASTQADEKWRKVALAESCRQLNCACERVMRTLCDSRSVASGDAE